MENSPIDITKVKLCRDDKTVRKERRRRKGGGVRNASEEVIERVAGRDCSYRA